jgi:hypothetical protein
LNQVAIPNANSSEWQPSVDGNYTVLVYDEFGCSTYSSEQLFTQVENAENTIAIYPIPASDILFLSHYGIADYDIIDVSGRSIQKGKVSGHSTIDVSNFSNGTYILHINQKNTRFVVAR